MYYQTDYHDNLTKSLVGLSESLAPFSMGDKLCDACLLFLTYVEVAGRIFCFKDPVWLELIGDFMSREWWLCKDLPIGVLTLRGEFCTVFGKPWLRRRSGDMTYIWLYGELG